MGRKRVPNRKLLKLATVCAFLLTALSMSGALYIRKQARFSSLQLGLEASRREHAEKRLAWIHGAINPALEIEAGAVINTSNDGRRDCVNYKNIKSGVYERFCSKEFSYYIGTNDPNKVLEMVRAAGEKQGLTNSSVDTNLAFYGTSGDSADVSLRAYSIDGRKETSNAHAMELFETYNYVIDLYYIDNYSTISRQLVFGMF